MGKGSNRRKESQKSFQEGFQRIFGDAKPKTSFKVFRRGTEQAGSSGVYIQPDIEPFISPIDGRTINSRSDLRDHNKNHGVTDSRDYSEGFLRRKHAERIAESTGDTREAKRERVAAIRRAFDKRS